jgi:hypothetical protein
MLRYGRRTAHSKLYARIFGYMSDGMYRLSCGSVDATSRVVCRKSSSPMLWRYASASRSVGEALPMY